MDLSFLTDEQLKAIQSGDLSSLPDDVLQKISAPSAQSEQAPLSSAGLPSHLLQAADEAFANGDTKELNRIKMAIDIFKSANPVQKPLTQAQLKEKAKGNISKDISNIFDLLPEIETYKGWKSFPAAGIQKVGAFVGENPELSQYRQKLNQLKIPVIKQVQGDSGAVSDTQEKSALEYFPYSSDTLFEEKGRPRAIVNLLQSVKAGTGVDLQDMVSNEQLTKAAGPDPEGYLKSYLAKILAGNQEEPATQQKKRFKVGPDGIPVEVN